MTYTISPTQIESFDPAQGGCERKWAFRKIDKISSPPNQYAQAGLDLHAVAEAWLRDGTPPDLTTPAGQAFNGGMHHLPPVGSVQVEQRATFNYLGVYYDQRIDYFGDRSLLNMAIPHRVTIGDHKSTGDLQWADEKQVALTSHTDPQWLMYGMWAVEEHGAKQVHGEWIYYLRRPPWSSRKLTVSASDWDIIAAFEQHIHPVSLRILAALNEPSDARPKNLEACGRYGGCPYRDRCLNGVSKAKRIAAMTEPSNTLEAARARLAARAQQTTNAPTGGGLAERLRARREAQATAPAAAPPEPVVDEATKAAWVPELPPEPEQTEPVSELETAEREANKALVAAMHESIVSQGVPEQPAEATDEPPKRKRGRPRKKPEVTKEQIVETVEHHIERDKIDAVVGRVGPSAVVEVPENTPSGPIGYVTTGTMVDAADFVRAQQREDYREILTRLHVAAIAAHAPPEVAGAHFDAILDKLEQGR